VTSYDAELQRHNEVLRQACAVQFRDHVLDIGCGTGQTTRDAARAAPSGNALGVDVSAAAISRAVALARAEGIRNVTFECADAQVHGFPREQFDLAISRFGTMFFDDPAAAFANIGRSLRPAGRLVMMVWQAHERNEWDVAIRQSLGVTAVPAGLPDAFSLADQPTVTAVLQDAGFADVSFFDVREPVYYGRDVAAAMEWVHGFTYTREALKQLAPAAAERASGRLRKALAARLGDDGVWFDSRAWIITARAAVDLSWGSGAGRRNEPSCRLRRTGLPGGRRGWRAGSSRRSRARRTAS
jgi:SAM-dependent methyltransferase